MDNLKKVELGKMLLNLNFDNDVNDFDWNNLINNLLNCNNNNISSGENKNTDAIELNKNQSNVIINNIIPNKNQTHFIELYPQSKNKPKRILTQCLNNETKEYKLTPRKSSVRTSIIQDVEKYEIFKNNKNNNNY